MGMISADHLAKLVGKINKMVNKGQVVDLKQLSQTHQEVSMITAFVVGLVSGLFLGWLRLRAVAKELVASTEARKQLAEALNNENSMMGTQITTINALGAENKNAHGPNFLSLHI